MCCERRSCILDTHTRHNRSADMSVETQGQRKLSLLVSISQSQRKLSLLGQTPRNPKTLNPKPATLKTALMCPGPMYQRKTDPGRRSPLTTMTQFFKGDPPKGKSALPEYLHEARKPSENVRNASIPDPPSTRGPIHAFYETLYVRYMNPKPF